MIATGKTIAVVGPHYVGKSTLCGLLEQKGFAILQEKWWLDPFRLLSKRDYFRSEIWFLNQTAQAMQKATALNKEGTNVLLDTFIYSIPIFAQTKLNSTEYKVFSNVFDLMVASVRLPHLVIYLHASPVYLYEKHRPLRIKANTGPTSDKNVSLDWLMKICRLHEKRFRKWDKTAFLSIDVSKRDIMKNIDEIEIEIRKKMRQ